MIEKSEIVSGPISGLSAFKLSSDEWMKLDKKFGNLCKFAAWQLLRKNIRSSHTDDLDDLEQELKKAVILAGMYYKRQMYIEACLESVGQFCKDEFLSRLVTELNDLWNNRTKHGANRQKFGSAQEKLLMSLVQNYVPKNFQPSTSEPLKMDAKFGRYCKAITWNSQKSLGRKITKERSIRSGIVSLGQFDFAVFHAADEESYE